MHRELASTWQMDFNVSKCAVFSIRAKSKRSIDDLGPEEGKLYPWTYQHATSQLVRKQHMKPLSDQLLPHAPGPHKRMFIAGDHKPM